MPQDILVVCSRLYYFNSIIGLVNPIQIQKVLLFKTFFFVCCKGRTVDEMNYDFQALALESRGIGEVRCIDVLTLSIVFSLKHYLHIMAKTRTSTALVYFLMLDPVNQWKCMWWDLWFSCLSREWINMVCGLFLIENSKSVETIFHISFGGRAQRIMWICTIKKAVGNYSKLMVRLKVAKINQHFVIPVYFSSCCLQKSFGNQMNLPKMEGKVCCLEKSGGTTPGEHLVRKLYTLR